MVLRYYSYHGNSIQRNKVNIRIQYSSSTFGTMYLRYYRNTVSDHYGILRTFGISYLMFLKYLRDLFSSLTPTPFPPMTRFN